MWAFVVCSVLKYRVLFIWKQIITTVALGSAFIENVEADLWIDPLVQTYNPMFSCFILASSSNHNASFLSVFIYVFSSIPNQDIWTFLTLPFNSQHRLSPLHQPIDKYSVCLVFFSVHCTAGKPAIWPSLRNLFAGAPLYVQEKYIKTNMSKVSKCIIQEV